MKHAAALLALAAASVLGVAACGGGGGGGGGGPSPIFSLTPQPGTHTAEPGEPALIAVPGYDYTNASSDVAAGAKELVKSDPVHFKSASAHNVLHEGSEIGGIILIQVKPQYDTPAVQRAVVPAMAAEMASPGAKVTLETIHTEKVLITQKDSQDVYVWFHAGALTIVAADSGKGPDIRDFVEAYLKTAHAAGAPGTPTATAPAATSPAPAISGPMTGQELLWLQAVEQLLPTMNKVFNNAPTNLTSSALASLARQVRGCSRELARIGSPPSARLQPVYELVHQACQAYDKGAQCFEDAARIGIPSSPAAERKFERKVDCGFAASGTGSEPLARAQIKASEIKAAAG